MANVDPYISCVLNSIFKISEIDPEWIQPDFSFSQDLELTPDQILAIGTNALKELGHQFDYDVSSMIKKTNTPRELVSAIKNIVESSMTNAA